ncbi:MAG: hypothetical protein IJ087_09890 [Eggerthellaceae bacterium]|nr:hypothetical protein [Eggerthellaceae bacterium]
MEPTEHIYPTLGVYVSELHAPVVTGGPRERVVRCRNCECFHSGSYGDECFRNSYLYDPSGTGLDIAVGGTFDVEPDGFCAWAEPKGGDSDAR